MTEKPIIIVGNNIGGGKTIAQIQDLVRIIKKIDGTKTSKIIAETYNKELQQLSDGRIGVRIWHDFDNTLRCVVVYPNSAVKERIEWGLNVW